MTHDQDIWKAMKTPKDLHANPWDDYGNIENQFLSLKNSGVCVRCPMSSTVHNVPYRRSISKGMARALRLLYRIQVSGINDGTAPNSFSDFTKLRYWGLIRQDENSSHWRITDNGIAFVEGKLTICKYAIITNNVRTAFLGDALSFNDCMR